MNLLNQSRSWLSTNSAASQTGLFHHHTQVFCRIQLLIRSFYAFVAFSSITFIPEWQGFISRASIDPLWPVFWLRRVDLHQGVLWIVVWYTVAAVTAASFPQFRWARILNFLGVLEFWAFNNSMGKIGHSYHGVLLVSFVLIFLPSRWHDGEQRNRTIKQSTLLVFWWAQATFMMTYTMAGLIKVVAGFYQIFQGQPSVFSPDALSRHIADRLYQTDSSSIFGGWLIDHVWVGWPLMLGTVYLELFAVLTLFRPRLQLFFVIGLIMFHVFSYFTMTIIFPPNCFLLFLFFAGMPLLRGPWKWSDFWLDMPIFGDAWSLWKKRAS